MVLKEQFFTRVRSFWSRSLRSGTLRSRSFGSEAKFGQFGRGHYGPGHFGRGHICLYFSHYYVFHGRVTLFFANNF